MWDVLSALADKVLVPALAGAALYAAQELTRRMMRERPKRKRKHKK